MGNEESSLFVSLEAGDQLRILGGPATIELIHKSGREARMRVMTNRDVVIEKVKDPRTVHEKM